MQITCNRNSASSVLAHHSNFVNGQDSTTWHIVWVAPHAHRSGCRACGRRHSVLGLFWSDFEYTTFL